MDVTFEDNSLKVKSLSANAKRLALWAIGAAAEGHAKDVITKEGRVDTGRMRNSVTHAEDENSSYVGTNVEYAIYNELGTVRMKGIHFLKKAATTHSKEYRGIVKDAYENA